MPHLGKNRPRDIAQSIFARHWFTTIRRPRWFATVDAHPLLASPAGSAPAANWAGGRLVAQTTRGFLFAAGFEVGREHDLRSQFVDSGFALLLRQLGIQE